ncbi:Uncharacterized protein OS=Singulisphaera acidiphila (strain ATCC BAA-1392 / DSM 18658 / VKM B-2454 / MOB10) GN=Sinac_1675 PE=4 SV=1 [Gemmata massiliana]|uniref:Uncharacterized protein n=1 Tax=Gemmata massiliana TaxID=1210884 RepID=A0A6P2CUC7_9BACT|nr:hypothetical protein [Gemmata massiliana]VTR92758.1 Uncharacterized protein OS=Singulisphaera acidiphila (strain ATCC BAA-1392 / DSM 18658 / VKM B-2454 / MOB10) GN=Sinac_1675 PE=4 SV=1 [Gemmata massiliana]
MWRMHDGNRVFTDAEWELFAAGLDLLCSFVESDISSGTNYTESGVGVFDRLTAEQKLALLADVASALRDPAIPMPFHTAANEGAIAAVFRSVWDALEEELDAQGSGEKRTEIRQLIRDAAADSLDRPNRLPSPKHPKRTVWKNLLELIEGRVFWDSDYALDDGLLDMPPEGTQAVLASLTIDPNYFLSVPRDPDEAGVIAARQTLARLLGLAVPDDHGLYPALDDRFHGLFVGPCSPEELARWEDHPWVRVVSSVSPDWECDLDEWAAHFRDAIPSTPFVIEPDTAGAWANIPLPDGIRPELFGAKWVIRDEVHGYWCDVVDNAWADVADEYIPIFGSEAEARAAYLQADHMYDERAARRRAAEALLGLEE